MAPHPNVPRGDASSIRNHYERLVAELDTAGLFTDDTRQYMRRRFIVLARRLESATNSGRSDVADDVADQEAVTKEEERLAEAVIGSMTDEDVVHILVNMANESGGDPIGRVSENEDEDEDESEWENAEDIEYDPPLAPDGPPERELDPEEGEPAPRINMASVKKRLAHITNLITENRAFQKSLDGYRLPKDYNASHIERLLAQAGCYPADTHLTPEELRSETVFAWLREFNIYLPGGPALPPPTGQAPPVIGTRAVQIPSRIGYSSPTITTFVEHHLILLLPSHPRYPTPDDRCNLCLEPYGKDRPPVLIHNAGACRGHMFCHQCLRGHLGSNSSVCNKCPTCRTRWFRPRRYEMREVMRSWNEADRREQAAAARDEDAFGGEPQRGEQHHSAPARVESQRGEQQHGEAEQGEVQPFEDSLRDIVVEGAGLIAGATWDAAVLAVREGAAGARWVYRKMGYGGP
jgi:hypothetical protein